MLTPTTLSRAPTLLRKSPLLEEAGVKAADTPGG
jgi:hypothetical protein